MSTLLSPGLVFGVAVFLGSFHLGSSGGSLEANARRLDSREPSSQQFSRQGYLQSQVSSRKDCPPDLFRPEGVLSSPLYPQTYPPNTDCYTKIQVENGRTIKLQFENILMERDPTCSADYVKVYDGSSIDSPSLGRFCSQNYSDPIIVHSKGRTILVHFHSDDIINLLGFRAFYTSQQQTVFCNVEKGQLRGIISSPSYPTTYPPKTTCQVPLETLPNSVITLHFLDINLENFRTCEYDRVEVRDGLSLGSRLLGTFCGVQGETKTITTTGNKMLVTFSSDSVLQGRGFKAEYLVLRKTKGDVLGHEPKIRSQESSLKLLEVPTNVTLKSEESHIFRCLPSKRNAQTLWFKGDKELTAYETDQRLRSLKIVGNHTLWIERMNVNLRGIYYCKVYDGEVKAEVSFAVGYGGPVDKKQPCEIVMRKTPQDLILTSGETAILPCEGAGPFVSITWQLNGKELPSNGHLTVLPAIGFLTINDSNPGSSGVFTCVTTDSVKNCSRMDSAAVTVLPKVKVEEVCGRPRHQARFEQSERISGGHDAGRGSHPWQAMLRYVSLKAFCSGALLNERWVITAAHCFDELGSYQSDIQVVLGKLLLNVTEPTEVVTHVRDIKIHPNYKRYTLDSDLALLELTDHIIFTKDISPVCLGEADFIERTFFEPVNTEAYVTGWGKTPTLQRGASRLQEVKLPIQSRSTCSSSTNFTVTENMFCAGDGVYKDACDGDSGGPLVSNHQSRWYILGVVSWGEGNKCGSTGKYGFYTKLNKFHPWIKSIIS